VNQKLAQALKYAMSQMSDTAKKLQDTASLCYTDEDVVDGFKLTQVARSMDELAEMLEGTAIDCQVSMAMLVKTVRCGRTYSVTEK
jgi:hypothetical protein